MSALVMVACCIGLKCLWLTVEFVRLDNGQERADLAMGKLVEFATR